MAKIIQSVQKVNDLAGNETEELKVVYTNEILSSVPKITANKDYRQVLAWVEAGNTIAEAD
jgi:hypothetical protein